MDSRIDLERLSQVLTDHPWLAEAMSNGAWWSSDGSVRVVAPVEDPLEVRAGLAALAEVLGCEATDVGVDGPAPAARVAGSSPRGVLRGRRVGTG